MEGVRKVCFVMGEAYPIISGGKGRVGGAELQSWLIARELAGHGKFKVHFIVRASEDGRALKDRVTVHKVRYTRPLFGHLKILREMLKVDADLYYQRTGGVATILVSSFCLLKGRKFIFHVSRDEQLNHDYPADKNRLVKLLYRIAVRRADAVLVQNNTQWERLGELGKKGILVKNLIKPCNNSFEKDSFILWVANISEAKQPLTCIALAESLPEYRFLMIGGAEDRELFRKVEEQAEGLPNLNFLGFKPFEEAEEYFKRAKVFINTSKVEGFPNTFLQAWSYGTPVVSLNIDPDEVICRHELGFHSKTLETMRRHISLLMEDENLNHKLGENGREYVKREHDIERIGEDLIKIFEGV